MSTNVFDDKARDWDNNPKHFNRSEAIAKKLIERLPLQNNMIALEYGAGTGILSHLMRNQFSEITLMDNSSEMIKMIHEKIQNLNIKNFTPLIFDLEHNEFTQKKFDIVFNQMVMHHVKDIPSILKQFYSLLKSDGYLAIADLYPEDGSFHGLDVDVHYGINPDDLTLQLKSLGFKNIVYDPCYNLVKELEDGSTRDYPIFLLTARK